MNAPYEVPEAWKLAFSLDEVAQAYGWYPVTRITSGDEVTVSYRPRAKPDDQIPGMIEELNNLD